MPSRVENLLVPFWIDGALVKENIETIAQVKTRVRTQLANLRPDSKRLLNPTPYKVIKAVFFNILHFKLEYFYFKIFI